MTYLFGFLIFSCGAFFGAIAMAFFAVGKDADGYDAPCSDYDAGK
jgi:hypothetical protein